MDGCFERTPYVSFIASVLVLTGAGAMCGTNHEALRRIFNIFEERFYPLMGSRLLQLIGVLYAVITISFGIVNLLFGVLVTGRTRQKVYAHKRAQSVGRTYSRCLLVTTYLLTFGWIFLFVAFAVPVTLWTMLHVVCRQETEYWRSISSDKDEIDFTYTFNLTHYGLYRRPLDTSLYTEYIKSPSAFTQLCQEISTVGPLFAIALFASLLVIIGLNCFISSLSNALVRLDFAHQIDYIRSLPNSTSVGPPDSEDYALHSLVGHSEPSFNPATIGSQPGSTFVYSERTPGFRIPNTGHQPYMQMHPVSGSVASGQLLVRN
ncbi:Neuronal membrane glycoprotein M6-b [Paragonimus heterotremus]|uniref:Neuronal membrane glycoprotein M6-b n=1 Tax=Paragonimus heterotremus TaxID=100268 RepID=A0A8J4WNR5_9TREM|nr:Neuronal membrane glycoprotein M6-b [Paragonimus heterotremus]